VAQDTKIERKCCVRANTLSIFGNKGEVWDS
jgi:hypothetical protein